MKVIVDQDKCIGCGLCANMAPELFTMENDKAVAADHEIQQEVQAKAEQTKNSCPVDAIRVE